MSTLSKAKNGDEEAFTLLIEEYKLPEMLGHYFSPRERDLFLDLMVYSIITENNAAQYYPDYGYIHPLPNWKHNWLNSVRCRVRNCSNCLLTATGHMMKWWHF